MNHLMWREWRVALTYLSPKNDYLVPIAEPHRELRLINSFDRQDQSSPICRESPLGKHRRAKSKVATLKR
jgi:hypothetical protein